MNRERIYLFDTTLRDGQQTPGIDFSVEDKIAVTDMLEELGVDYVEGGYPGANPTDTEFFSRKRTSKAKFIAFGMTKRAGVSASNDPGLAALLQSQTDAICYRRQELGLPCARRARLSNEENLDCIRESVAATHRHRARSAGRLRAFLRRLQGQSGLCAGLRPHGARCRRALGGAVRHQWRHAAVRGARRSSRAVIAAGIPGEQARHPRP